MSLTAAGNEKTNEIR